MGEIRRLLPIGLVALAFFAAMAAVAVQNRDSAGLPDIVSFPDPSLRLSVLPEKSIAGGLGRRAGPALMCAVVSGSRFLVNLAVTL